MSGLGGTGLYAISLFPVGLSLLLLESSLGGIGLVEVGEGGAGLPGMNFLGVRPRSFQSSCFLKPERSLSGIGLQDTGAGLDDSWRPGICPLLVDPFFSFLLE